VIVNKTVRSQPGAETHLPGPAVNPIRRTLRYGLARLASSIIVRVLFRVRIEGRERLPAGPSLVCFSHQSWLDPFILLAVMPSRPRLYFFGPKEEDMTVGGRNRLMAWTGTPVPYKPGKNDLLDATRRVKAIFDAGGTLAIAGEGQLHAGEGELLPLNEGAAFFALRSGVPIVPVAINGTSWLAFGRRVRVRIGEPILSSGRPTREAVAALTGRTWATLHELCQGYPDSAPPAPGSPWARLTELFNEWPEGRRPPGPSPRG
jgi:1-acyl-sn-glycerol-3-phosphate acyltransferase